MFENIHIYMFVSCFSYENLGHLFLGIPESIGHCTLRDKSRRHHDGGVGLDYWVMFFVVDDSRPKWH